MKRHKTFICRCNENRAYAVKSIQFFFFHATNMPPLFHTFIHFFLSNKVAVVYCIRFIYVRGEEQKREDVLCKCFYQNVLCDILKVHQRASTCCSMYRALHVWMFSSFVILSSTVQTYGVVISSKPFFIDDFREGLSYFFYIYIKFLGAPDCLLPPPPLLYLTPYVVCVCVTVSRCFPVHLPATNLSNVFNLLLVLWFCFWDGEISAKVQLR